MKRLSNLLTNVQKYTSFLRPLKNRFILVKSKLTTRFLALNKKVRIGIVGLIVLAVLLPATFLIWRAVSLRNSLGKYPRGVLAINTDKSVYAINEKIEIGLASLDYKGNTLCNSNLKVTVTLPSGQKTELSTQSSSIITSTTCSPDNNVTNNSDYRANFTPQELGDYKLELTNVDNKHTQTTQFSVKDTQQFSVSRYGASRLNPFKADRYPMAITVKAREDFKGQLVEQIPAAFDVIWQGKSKVETVINKKSGDYKTITWEVDLKAGESKDFIYEYQSAKVSPEIYLLGAARLLQNGQEVFKEGRVWQLANDASRLYLPSTGSAPASPAYDTNWEVNTSGARLPMYTTKQSTTMTSASISGDADKTDKDYLVRQYVSDTLGSQTIAAQTVKFQIRALETNAANNLFTSISIRSWNGSTFQTLLTLSRDDTEVPITTLTNRQYSATTSAVTVAAGDRLVIEVGLSGDPAQSGSDYHNGSLRIGDVAASDLPENDTGTDDYNPWVEFANTVTFKSSADISGTVYTNEGKSANIGISKTVHLFVNGTDKSTAETNSSGQYSFTGVTGIAPNDSVIVYLDDETENGSDTTVALSGYMDITSFDIITDRVIVQSESGAITITDLDDVDGVDATDEDGLTVSGSTLTVANTFELMVPINEGFTPGGNINAEKLHIKGIYTGGSGTITLSGSGTGACGVSQSTTLPLCVDTGSTFTPNSNTVTFTGSSSSNFQNTTYNNVIINGAGPFASLGNTTIGGTLTITSGTLSSNSTYTLSVTGITSITGSLTLAGSGNTTFTGATTINSGGTFTRSNASGTNIFVGLLTISNGGTFTTSNNPAFTLRGGLANSGTFTSGTGTYTFNTNGQSISGSAATSFGGVVAISGAITVQNSNTDTVTVSGNLTGDNVSSVWQNNANATVKLGGTVMSTGSITANANPNTVEYTGASQTVKPVAYHHLILSGSGTPVLTNVSSIAGTLTTSGTVTPSVGNANLTCGAHGRYRNYPHCSIQLHTIC